MTKPTSSRQGFTLVELSIVLVIIGLIIGGVITGRQIISNAQITNATNALQAYQAQFQTYVQNYGAMPGDDAAASDRFTTTNVPDHGDGDGTLEGAFDSTTVSDETRILWAAMRAASLVKPQAAGAVKTAQPSNPFNGIFGFQHGAFNNAIATNVICMNGVPADAAQAIDSRLDDGGSSTGTIRAMIDSGTRGIATAGKPADNYTAGNSYILCASM